MDDGLTDRPDGGFDLPVPRARRGTTPIKIRPPRVVSISDDDYQQAVSALVTMMTSWWHNHENHQTE